MVNSKSVRLAFYFTSSSLRSLAASSPCAAVPDQVDSPVLVVFRVLVELIVSLSWMPSPEEMAFPSLYALYVALAAHVVGV